VTRAIALLGVLACASCFYIDKITPSQRYACEKDPARCEQTPPEDLPDDPMNPDVVPDPCPITVEPVFPGHAAWNDYVRKTDVTKPAHLQAEVACGGFEPGRYAACIHGGELKKATVGCATSCAGLQAADTLGVFDWRCEDQSGGVVFYSAGFRKGRGLSQLVGSTGFLPNALTVSQAGATIATSQAGAWWPNAVLPLPDSGALSQAGAVYVLAASHASSGFSIDADRVALVTLPGAVLSSSGATASCKGTYRAPVCAEAKKFLWLEGDFELSGADRLHLDTSTFSRVHNLRAFGGETGLGLDECRAVLVSDSRFERNTAYGLDVGGGSENTFVRVYSANNGEHGVREAGDRDVYSDFSGTAHLFYGFWCDNCDDLTVTNLFTAANREWGFRGPGNNATLLNVTSAGNGGSGIYLIGLETTAAQIATIANGNDGLEINNFGLEARNTFQTIAAVSNENDGVSLNGTATSFGDRLWVGGNGGDNCDVPPGEATNTIDQTCAHGGGLATAPLFADLSGAFVGRIVGDDSDNASDQGGQCLFAALNDWSHFSSPMRVWGRSAATALPESGTRGRCDSGTCQIWDWRPRASDTVLRGANGTFTAGAACPESVDGDRALANNKALSGTTPDVFLVAATEIMLDGVGDDDGLCESNEACVFAPNIGAYQGEGALLGPCTFKNGVVKNVTMYGYTITALP
jgi:hypothetical protein